eukprot:CAMPEP_0115860832 /NCGR_PEP_ID=MMETSP0287-20121206/17334_1 /TAXON_ID=412157 /ORGANISM="Chrysochromulina rotalis, Strain UIO044" /LENGTH=98 /DNA_ID=CAMNT_0003315175 /DNA_START=691 /DNA_END=984 /DNA_ORIENTATION=-
MTSVASPISSWTRWSLSIPAILPWAPVVLRLSRSRRAACIAGLAVLAVGQLRQPAAIAPSAPVVLRLSRSRRAACIAGLAVLAVGQLRQPPAILPWAP